MQYATNPDVIIISVGKDNEYGHPHHEIMERANEIGAKVYRTDELGHIVITTDGKSYSVNNTIYTPSQNTPSLTEQQSNDLDNNVSEKVVIKSIDLGEEIVVIKNEGSSAVNMSGWKLISVKGNQTFTFPTGFVLQPGATVRVVSGPGVAGDGVNILKWTGRYIWNNDGDPGALYNAAGVKVSEK